MASVSPTPLLDLAETVSRTALIITKSLLQANHAPALVELPESPPGTGSIKETNGSNGAKETSGINGIQKGPQGPSPAAKELIMARQALNLAASELLVHAMGPDNYLKSFSYGVNWLLHISVV